MGVILSVSEESPKVDSLEILRLRLRMTGTGMRCRRGVVGAAPYTIHGGAAGNVGAGALDGPERSE